MKPNKKKTPSKNPIKPPPTASVEGSSSMKLLASVLLIAYGYVTVLTPNWMAFDSNATKFYTFAILNLVVVGLVFFIKEFRERTQLLFVFFTNKIAKENSLFSLIYYSFLSCLDGIGFGDLQQKEFSTFGSCNDNSFVL